MLFTLAAISAGGCATTSRDSLTASLRGPVMAGPAGASLPVQAQADARPADDGPGAAPLPVDSLPAEPQLADYLAYAALHNAGLEAAFLQFRAALERVPQVEALPDPRLSYRYLIEEVETRVGPQRQVWGCNRRFRGSGSSPFVVTRPPRLQRPRGRTTSH